MGNLYTFHLFCCEMKTDLKSQFIKKKKKDFSGGASGKEPTCQCRRHKKPMGSILGSGRSPGRGHGNLLQYSYLEDPMDRGTWSP